MANHIHLRRHAFSCADRTFDTPTKFNELVLASAALLMFPFVLICFFIQGNDSPLTCCGCCRTRIVVLGFSYDFKDDEEQPIALKEDVCYFSPECGEKNDLHSLLRTIV